MRGRSSEERLAIGAAVQQAMTETIDVPPDDVFQVIAENDLVDWSFGEGVAQLVN
jgi:hypothetical protein